MKTTRGERSRTINNDVILTAMMTTNEIRSKFLNFFQSKGHRIVDSDSLVPKDDPTVLFTTAGMQQFKPQFLGHIEGFTRAATCQKCLRTDDLSVVGQTDFHHTFFEMLGNFSFGDYFKKEAIGWAWEFLTQELKIPQEKLWVSVYKEDDEAYDIWLKSIKVPPAKIVKLSDKSNFWPSEAKEKGPNGPCGPCSEIFYDYGPNPHCPRGKHCDPDCSCGRFSEVWNLVFTQFNRKDGGLLEPLPAKNIDTGMGLERLAAVVQGKKSNYETDRFSAILKAIKDAFAAQSAKATESEFRVIADHVRAVVVAIADGVMPSNEGRGYVIRKLIVDMSDLIIRCGIQKAVLHTFVDVVIKGLQDPYPEVAVKADEIKELIQRAEESFIKIRRERLPELKEKIEKAKGDSKELGDIFFLYRDTYGMSLTTIHQVSHDVGVGPFMLNEADKEFNGRMEQQKNRSRASSKMTGVVYAEQDISLKFPKTEFLGYKETQAKAHVLNIFTGQKWQEASQAGPKEKVTIILDRTPFYAESGGQVGDSGYLMGLGTSLKVRVTGTLKSVIGHYLHRGVVEEGLIKTSDDVQALIDEPRRRSIMRNHTATHLLQAALREVLGPHVKQQGSLVEESHLRFDFTHPSAIKPEDLKKIENRIQEYINRGDLVRTEILSLEEAKQKGALAFFAEKYGQTVRVVSIGEYSKEFCGGTHVSSTKDIECVKIVSEGSVAQGIRRIEALTGHAAVDDFLNKKALELASVEDVQRRKQQEKEKQETYLQQAKSSVDQLIADGENIKGVKLIATSLQAVDAAFLRKLSDSLRQKVKSGVFILGAKGPEDVSLVLSITDDLVSRGLNAHELMGQIAPLLEGRGGGKPHLAQAGSQKPQKLVEALGQAKAIIESELLKYKD